MTNLAEASVVKPKTAATPSYEKLRSLPVGPQVIPIVDQLTRVLGGTMAMLVPELDLNSGEVSEWVEGQAVEYFVVTPNTASIQPALHEFMTEFPGVLCSLDNIHQALLQNAIAETGHPARSPFVTEQVRHQADLINVALRERIEARIQESVRVKLTQAGIADMYGIHADRITQQLFDSLVRGEYWAFDHSSVISAEDERELVELTGQPITIDWLSAGLEGKIPKK